MGGPQVRSGGSVEQQNVLVVRGFKYRIAHPVAQSPYRLHCHIIARLYTYSETLPPSSQVPVSLINVNCRRLKCSFRSPPLKWCSCTRIHTPHARAIFSRSPLFSLVSEGKVGVKNRCSVYDHPLHSFMGGGGGGSSSSPKRQLLS
jgi:hypothetical protein